MAEIISFSAAVKKKLLQSCEALAQRETNGLDEPQLRNLLTEVREKLRQMDEIEPADMDSEAYETWTDVHEQMEDLQDEILDVLDRLT